MCLAIPARVTVMLEDQMAEVDIHGVTRTVSLSMTPDAEVDSWVLIHAGFAIQVVDEQYANETWELLLEMGDALSAEDAELLNASAAAAMAEDPQA
jgi:hydrogenase expression/formation protein HypC